MDYQAIYFGIIRQDDLIRAVGCLERYKRSPIDLTNIQEFEIQNDPYILELKKTIIKYNTKIKGKGYSIFKTAENIRLYE
jgi:hypothetical protein